MRKIIYLFLFTSILTSCDHREKLIFNELVGEYYHGNDSTSYNHLILRGDSTFTFEQSPQWSDIWLRFNGTWNIKNDILTLTKGIDFSENLIVNKTPGFDSDSLEITLDNSLTSRFPQLKLLVSFNNEDLIMSNNKISIYKPDYWDTTKTHGKDYEYCPVDLHLRDGKYYARAFCLFQNSYLEISFNEEIPLKTERSVLCKYKKIDNILYSFSESFEIERHDLKKIKSKN